MAYESGCCFAPVDRSRRWLSICAVGNLSNKSIGAKNWKRTWLRSATSLRDASVDDFSGNWLSYVSANDRKDAGVAATHLERCLERAQILPLSTRDVIAQEAAVFSAWFRDDASLADRWVAQLRKPALMQRFVKIRLDVALRCARRDYAGAENAWRDGLAFIEKSYLRIFPRAGWSGKQKSWSGKSSVFLLKRRWLISLYLPTRKLSFRRLNNLPSLDGTEPRYHTCINQKQRPPVLAGGLKPRLLRFAGTDEGVRPYSGKTSFRTVGRLRFFRRLLGGSTVCWLRGRPR
jgi:hypothetical protein